MIQHPENRRVVWESQKGERDSRKKDAGSV